MSRNNIIILSLAIIFLIVAIAVFFYANFLRSEKNINNNSVSQTNEISMNNSNDDEENKPNFYFYDINCNDVLEIR